MSVSDFRHFNFKNGWTMYLLAKISYNILVLDLVWIQVLFVEFIRFGFYWHKCTQQSVRVLCTTIKRTSNQQIQWPDQKLCRDVQNRRFLIFSWRIQICTNLRIPKIVYFLKIKQFLAKRIWTSFFFDLSLKEIFTNWIINHKINKIFSKSVKFL